jgi:hypothetical protein
VIGKENMASCSKQEPPLLQAAVPDEEEKRFQGEAVFDCAFYVQMIAHNALFSRIHERYNKSRVPDHSA